MRTEYRSPSQSVNCPVILFVVTGISLLIFVAAEKGASELLPSKMTSTSAAIPAFRQCSWNRCLANGHILSKYQQISKRNKLLRDEED
jgi:hypothetical protein